MDFSKVFDKMQFERHFLIRFSILVQCTNGQRWWRRRRNGGSSSSIIIELQAMMTMGLTHIALHCRDQLGQSKQSRASQQGQMFCSPCQIWSQDTPFISFVTLVSKNFAAYLRFLKWKPFLAFHFPVTMGFEMLKPHNRDARVTINLDIAWLRLIQLLLVPPPGRAGCLWSRPAKNFLRIFHGLDCEEIRITLNWASLLRIEQKTSLCCAIVCDIAHILLFKGDLASNKQDQGGRLGQGSEWPVWSLPLLNWIH